MDIKSIREEKVCINKLLQEHYDIGAIQGINKMTNGASSSCYHITAKKGEFIFKNIEKNFMNYPYNEYKINEILAEENIPVSKFIAAKNGEFVITRGEEVYHLQSFVEGNICSLNTAPQWLLTESAQMLGRIQKALENIPKLPVGIGKGFFEYLTPENAKANYLDILKLAQKDSEVVEDIQYRISLLEVIKNVDFDIDRLTCKNTHGDYFISQIICGANSINAIIDFTSACVHPICWEVIRSYTFADPKCKDGNIDVENLKRYIMDYLKYGELNKYDLKNMPYLYFYQLVVSNYFSQYYTSNNANKHLLLNYALFSTKLCKWFEYNVDKLSDELLKAF